MFWKKSKFDGDFVPVESAGGALHDKACAAGIYPEAVTIAAAPGATASAVNGAAVSVHSAAHAIAGDRGIAVALAGTAFNRQGIAVASAIASPAFAEGQIVVAVGPQASGRVWRGELGIALDGAVIELENGANAFLINDRLPGLAKIAPKAGVHVIAGDRIPRVQFCAGILDVPFVGFWGGEFHRFKTRDQAIAAWNEWRMNSFPEKTENEEEMEEEE